jgi:hypothetical protein
VKLEALFAQPDALPPIPTVMQELIASFNDEAVATGTIAQHISSDQVVSAKLLQLAHSPCYQVPNTISTVPDAVANISLRADAVERAKDLRNLAEDGHAGIEQLQPTYRVHQTDTRFELERMVEKIESMYCRFGLSESQEAEIIESARVSKDGVLKLFDRYGVDFDKRFAIILDGLNRASTYQIDMEEGSAQASEVWV